MDVTEELIVEASVKPWAACPPFPGFQAPVLLSFISRLPSVWNGVAKQRARLPSHDSKGKTDCLVRPGNKKGCFSCPLRHGSASQVTKEQAETDFLVFPLPASTTLSPERRRKTVVKIQKPRRHLWLSNDSEGETISTPF